VVKAQECLRVRRAFLAARGVLWLVFENGVPVSDTRMLSPTKHGAQSRS
jgi:hypothetical protein